MADRARSKKTFVMLEKSCVPLAVRQQGREPALPGVVAGDRSLVGLVRQTSYKTKLDSNFLLAFEGTDSDRIKVSIYTLQ